MWRWLVAALASALTATSCAVPLPIAEPTQIVAPWATPPTPATFSFAPTRVATNTAVPRRTAEAAGVAPTGESTPSPLPALDIATPTPPPPPATATDAAAPTPTNPLPGVPTSAPTPIPPTTVRATIPAGTPVGLVSIPGATVSYYDVQGSTAAQLRDQLNLLGPIDVDGKRWDSVTTWRIAWRLPTAADGVCLIDQTTVSVTMDVKFPRWTPPSGVSTDLARQWIGYTQALATHERGHVDIAQRGVAAMQAALRSSTCAAAPEMAQAQMDSINSQEEAYDRDTGHGVSQGAHFP